MAAKDAVVSKCEAFVAHLTEQYGLDGVILFINKQDEGVVEVFQNGHPLVNLEMTRRFVLINDSEAMAMRIAEVLTEGEEEEMEADDSGA